MDARKSIARIFLFWLGVLGGLALLALAWIHRGYYGLPESQRPLHADYEFLRSSGKGGLSLGVVGTFLIALNLAYLARVRILRMEWLGSQRTWMALHVLTGLLGSGFILLHSNFLPRSALGILSSFSLAVVVGTGVIGRYFYSRVPRSLEGRELEIEEIRKALRDHQQEMDRLGFRHPLFDSSIALEPSEARAGFWPSVQSLISGDRQIRSELSALKKELQASPALHRNQGPILALMERYCRERQWLVRYAQLRSLMSSWRFFHRWFAILMLATVAFHIAVAIGLGNLWFLGGMR